MVVAIFACLEQVVSKDSVSVHKAKCVVAVFAWTYKVILATVERVDSLVGSGSVVLKGSASSVVVANIPSFAMDAV